MHQMHVYINLFITTLELSTMLFTPYILLLCCTGPVGKEISTTIYILVVLMYI